MIRRRTMLRWGPVVGVGALLGPALATPAVAGLAAGLGLHNLHTGERLHVDLPKASDWPEDALQAVARVLRDHRSGEVHRIDTALLGQLLALQRQLGFMAPFHVISGYRSPATNARLAAASGGVARTSMHMQGRAIDIRVPGVALADVHRAAMALQAGGVGLYRKSDFVHLDTGRVRAW